ncbi:(2Fe-2S)-binding protein [Deinococcus sp. 14RED07]|uniref:(2Fe-2S)-binding protein n=1 Tax=Deinococcus sp. 14RED07 TaxID=2745874 RepID=UPI001E525BF7|nr:(2Fe-2S)-binding protein [Deinococcus sp. 14RED07]MCD0177536.1 (2Fe-2S)-binding protein [Deinococcus sp. 14RED07]
MSHSATLPDPDLALTFVVNGKQEEVRVPVQATLLDVLRERLHLTGTKKGCDHGQCGACTVHVNGQTHLSCLTLALSCEGREVTTIEGLAPAGGGLHPMQAAFIEHDAFQCGYCTPGQIMSAVACVEQARAGDADAIREFMSGNLCRCAAYPQIVAAIQDVAGTSDQGAGADQ